MGINKRYLYVSEDSLNANNDFLRAELGSLWTVTSGKNPQIRFGKKITEKPFKIEFGPVMVTEGATAPYSAKHQIVKLSPNPKRFGVYPECLECDWPDYVKNITKDFSWAQGLDPQTALRLYVENQNLLNSGTGVTDSTDTGNTAIDYSAIAEAIASVMAATYQSYKDCVFSIEAPLTKEEADFSGTQNKFIYGNVNFEYDYYLEDYEKAIESLQLSEIDLPNLYFLLGEEESTSIITKLKDNGKCRAKEYIALLGSAYDTLLIPNRVVPQMAAINTFKEFVPFQAEVGFTTDTLTAAADSIRDSELECGLMRRMSEFPADLSRPFVVAQEMYISKGGKRYKKFNISKPQVKSYDLFKWLAAEQSGEDVNGGALTEQLPSGHTFLGPDNNSTMLALSGQKNNLRKMMAFLILSGRVKDLLSTNNRSIQDILMGAESHSETVLYKVEKHNTIMYDLYEKALSEEGIEVVAIESEDSENSGNTAINLDAIAEALTEIISEAPPDPIQTMWLANSSDIDIFEYVDTQVKYGSDYTYIVTAYQLAVGSEYYYFSNKTDCEGWEVSLPLQTAGHATEINNLISTSETMEAAYSNISAYLMSLGLVSPLPDYCGGDLHLSTDSLPGMVMPIYTMTCACCDTNTSGARKRCLENLCKKFKNIRNQASEEALYSGDYEAQVSKTILNLGGRRPEIIYEDLISSGKSSQQALGDMSKILLNVLEYNLNYEIGGLSIQAQDINGVLDFKIVKDWQFSKQEEAASSYSPRPESNETLSGRGGCNNNNRNVAKKRAGFREILDYDFDVNKECPTTVDPCEYVFTATTIPNVMIYEVPYFIYNGTMIDTPPVQPGLEIIPYRNVNNKLLFNFNTGIGDYYDVPKIILPSDKELFKKTMQAQGVGTSRQIRFKSDDPAKAFQIFRSEEEPRRYRDFADKLIKVVPTDVNLTTIQKADAASHIEEIRPNKKYYYTFRTVDIHGHISNPTPIYEVELVDDDGAIYPIIKIVNIEAYTPDNNILSKKAMKLLHIVPTISQGIVNEEASNLDGASTVLSSGKDIALGVKQQSVWGKKFKVRLVSRKTGRKIDLNISFKTKHIKNPDAGCMLEVAEATASVTSETPAYAIGGTEAPIVAPNAPSVLASTPAATDTMPSQATFGDY